MGGCLCKKKLPPVDMNLYLDFHATNPPEPTNELDKRYLDVRGESATFAAGESAKVQAAFDLLPGVIRSRVGYSGGTKNIGKYPDQIHDHTEFVDLEFDPEKTCYEDLLRLFFTLHDATKKQNDIIETQYMSKIFYHSKDQRQLAEAEIMELDRKLNESVKNQLEMRRVRTDVEKAKYVFVAKMEDQHVYLQKDETLSKFANCPTPEQLTYSHVACKLNGLASGNATMDQLKEINADLRLPDDIYEYLTRLVSK